MTAPRHGEWFPRYPFGRETPSEGPVALFYRLRSRIPSHFVTAPRGDLQFGVRIASRYSIDLQILRKRLQKTETYISQFSPIKYCRSPISWMVRCQTPEPSTITPQITDGPISRPEPSTLEAGITDGPIPQDRTFHAGDPNRGWFNAQNGTFDAGCRRSWTVQGYRHSNSAHSSNSRQASGPFPGARRSPDGL